MQIKCISSTDSIVLHSKNLKIDQGNAALRHLNQTDVNITISKISEDTDNDLLILTLSENLQADHHYEVELHFEGKLQEEKVGFYKSSYLGKEKQEKWIAVTYFRPDNARRAFPCFDELTFKAKFTISLGRTIKFHSLSNMQLLRTEEM